MTDVITLAQAKAFLNITDATADAELPFYMDAAQAMWVNRGYPVGTPAEPVDEWYDGGTDTIVTRSGPIDSVQLITESWGSVTYTLVEHDTGTSGYAWAYTVDLQTGTFIRRAAGIATFFAPGVRNVHIQYTPGFTVVPSDIQLAILLLLKHMWSTQRGIGKRPGTGGNDDVAAKEGFAWPYRVQQIADGYPVFGIA